MFQTKVVEKIETYSVFKTSFFDSLFAYDMWKNVVQPGRQQMT